MITKEQIKEQLRDPEWVSPAGKEDGRTRAIWDPMWGMRIFALREPSAKGWVAHAITPAYSAEICVDKTFPEMEEQVKEWIADEIYHTLKQSKNG